MEKLFVYDFETTGTDPKRHGIHQIAVMIYINGRLVDTIFENMRIYSDQEIEQEALELCNITPEHLHYYQDPEDVYQKLKKYFQNIATGTTGMIVLHCLDIVIQLSIIYFFESFFFAIMTMTSIITFIANPLMFI